MNKLLKVAPLALALVIAACASSSPAPVLLTLPPVATATMPAAPGGAASSPLLEVRRVAIPEYLVARRVRYRADAATLAEWPNTYWAERIEIGVSREFVSAIGQQLPGWTICDASCGDQVPVLRLQVTLLTMDFVRSARKLHARARVAVNGPGALAKVLGFREIDVDVPAESDTAQGQAQTISTLLEKIAADAAVLVRDARP